MYSKMQLLNKYFDLITIKTANGYFVITGHRGEDEIYRTEEELDTAVDSLFYYTVNKLVDDVQA